jgi:hypothetical protein
MFGVLYALMAVAFILYPSELVKAVNLGAHFFPNLDPSPPPNENLWSIFGATSCATLATISFLGAESPRVRGYGLAHLLAKTMGILTFFYFFMNFQKYFAYLLGGVVESLIFLLLLWRLLRSGATSEVQSASQKAPAP